MLESYANELVCFKTCQDIWISLLFDDWFRNRPNRRAIFKDKYKLVVISYTVGDGW